MENVSRRGFLGTLGKGLAGVLVSSAFPNIVEASLNKTIYMPSLGRVSLNDPVIPGGNFYWSEVTKGGLRLPKYEEQADRIIKVAKTMEEVRKHFGNKPISINSWYRDSLSNKMVGGAKNSRHLQGDAVDFNVQGLHPYEVHDELVKFWGDKGGLGRYHSFTHLDIRGYKARWNGS